MREGRHRGPLSLSVCRKVPVDLRCSRAGKNPLASISQSRRAVLRSLAGGGAALLAALAASGHPVSAQEMSDPGPGRWQSGAEEVVVSLGAQRLWAYEGEDLILTTLVSTGTAETPEVATPIGQWRILVKLPLETMTGTVNGEPYEVPDVPFVMYFTEEGHALHGTYWHNNFGTPMSHGCIHLRPSEAEYLFNWADPGTEVYVHW